MSVSSATFLAGAKGRLLPASLVFRFFIAAAFYHAAAWALLALHGEGLIGYRGGPGPVLAAIHLITLGVLVMTAIGAALQLLSVVTKRPITAVGLCQLMSWLYIPGVALLTYGMTIGDGTVMMIGGVAVAAALAIFAVLIAGNLRGATQIDLTVAHVWLALLALLILALLALALIADYDLGFFDNHAGAALAHFVIAAFGFMGLLALGFSHVLVPMFALAPAPKPFLGYVTMGLITAAIALAAGGALWDLPLLIAAASLIGLAGMGLHLRAMLTVLKTRMRQRLGLSFLLVRAAWALLPASLVLALLAALGLVGDSGATLAGFIIIAGWLLTFLLGILQRIMPFLATMHAGGPGGRPVSVSALTNEPALRVHGICHGLGLVAVAAGIIAETPLLVTLGAVVGVAGALAFLWFAGDVVRRTIMG